MNTQNNIKWFKKDALNEFCDPTNRAHQNSERQLHSNQHLGCPNTELIRRLTMKRYGQQQRGEL